MNYFPEVWVQLIRDIFDKGEVVSPRGQLTRELPQHTITVDMRRPVLTVPDRKMHYQFMAAEAYWILTADDKVSTIAPYNKHIAKFSDDGETFFGAYGPKIANQIGYVVAKLSQDPDTRQAGLTIWRESPPDTKDVPCTVAIFFSIRHQKLNCHVFMRSSDAWLGIPYDVFNFSMLSHVVCTLLRTNGIEVSPGELYLTAASSHLYEKNFDAIGQFPSAASLFPSTAGQVLPTTDGILPQRKTPTAFFRVVGKVEDTLEALRTSKPGHPLRWWEPRDE